MLRHLLSDALLKSDLLRQGDVLACAWWMPKRSSGMLFNKLLRFRVYGFRAVWGALILVLYLKLALVWLWQDLMQVLPRNLAVPEVVQQPL